MKTSPLIIGLFVVLLIGCAPARATITTYGDDFIKQYGDDVVRISSQSADDVGRQYSDDVIRYWDDVLSRTPQTIGDTPPVLVYKTATRLYPEQKYVFEKLQSELLLTKDEAALYLQGVCQVSSWVSIIGSYPSEESTQAYVANLAEAHGIKLLSLLEFAQSIRDFSAGLIENENFNSRQEGAKIIFEALCLLPE